MDLNKEIPVNSQLRCDWDDDMTIIAHPALQFCWHIRVGFYRQVDCARMWKYARFFYKNYLAVHLDRQQKRLSSSGEISPPVWRETIMAHRKLHRLFISAPESERTLGRIEEQLEVYVRFERRSLLNQYDLFRANGIMTTRERCEMLFDVRLSVQLESWTDRFWELR